MNSTKYDELELSTLKYSELQGLCKEEGLKANSKKVDLIASLKTIPSSIFVNDTCSSSSSANSTLISDTSEVNNTVSGPAVAQRPAFGDISIITINSPLIDGLGGRAKKRKVADECSDKENSDMFATARMSTSPLREGNLQKLAEDVRNRENEMEKLLKQFEEPARKVADFIQLKKTELDKCRTTGEKHYSLMLEKQLEEKERELQEKHANEMKSLKSQTEISQRVLHNKLNEALQESKKMEEDKSALQLSLKNELQKNADSLRAHIEKGAQKDREIAVLNTAVISSKRNNEIMKTELDSVRTSLKQRESEKGTLQTLFHDMTKKLSTKDAEIKRLTELMQTLQQGTSDSGGIMDALDDELTCIICQELFVSASTLPCAHSFCEMCLRTWFKTKKTCPVCRADVKLKVVFSVVLDSIVECMIEKSSDDAKRKRTILLRERNEAKRTADAAADPQGVKAMFYKVGDVVSAAPAAAGAAAAASSGGAGAGAAARGGAGVNANRRRSRSQSPARGIVNRFQHGQQQHRVNINNNNNSNNNQYQHYRIRCFNCGQNHHIRDCPYNRGRGYQQR